jgi:pilus assembly protein CpaB
VKNPKMVIAVALVLGLISAGMVYRYAARFNEKAPEPAKTTVVIASRAIAPQTRVEKDALKMAEVPVEHVHPDSLRDVDDVAGRIARGEILPGEQVLEGRLYERGERPGMSFIIPEGKRAVTIAVNEVLGVAGFINTGDYVDVLGTFDGGVAGEDLTATILQHVQVLAVAQRMERTGDEKPKVTTTVTLAVTPKEAEKVTFAEERGRLRLALRPAESAARVSHLAPVTAQEVVGKSVKQAAVVVQPVEALPPKPSWSVEIIRGTKKEEVNLY